MVPGALIFSRQKYEAAITSNQVVVGTFEVRLKLSRKFQSLLH